MRFDTYFPKIPKIEDINERTKLKIMAVTKPPTSNPSINLLTSKMNAALMTMENNPRVSKFIGRANILTMGFMKVFMTPSATATITAVKKLSNATLGITYAAIATASALIRILTINFITTRLSQEGECVK